MVNQIKHNSPSEVLSHFNPIASLKPDIRKIVNEKFILPILDSFFRDKGGLSSYSELNPDDLITEIEFKKEKNLVQSYIYKKIIDDISKQDNGIVDFKPKFVITFDEDLVDLENKDTNVYPYTTIFKNNNGVNPRIKFGKIQLGKSPILYYIYIDLQKLIKFIKTLNYTPIVTQETVKQNINKIPETEAEKNAKLYDALISEEVRQMHDATESQIVQIRENIDRLVQERNRPLEGQSGKLRVNLTWHTTDDLDLHIVTPNGEIYFSKKVIENQGVIGELDVDKNAGATNAVSNPQENIHFNAMPKGLHKVYVNFFAQRERDEVPFTVKIIPDDNDGKIFTKTVKGKGNKAFITAFKYENGKLYFIDSP